MGVGGVGSGGGGPWRPEEPQRPSGPEGEFQLPLDWRAKVEEAAHLINPDDPHDVPSAVRSLTDLSQDARTPHPVQQVTHQVVEQIEQGYMVSKNPIELVQPYLALCNLTQPIGPGHA